MLSRIHFLLICLLLTMLSVAVHAAPNDTLTVMSYNVENLFDTKHQEPNNDEEYTPQGIRHWTSQRLQLKLANISRVIACANGWNAPAIVGLCEVENDDVLKQLIKVAPLKNLHYRFVHFDSPDVRGIDVALLYQPSRFRLLNARPIPAAPANTEHPTRDILYVSGIAQHDTLHLFVCHFPSRLGGQQQSEPRRIEAARRLRMAVDSVFTLNPEARIIIMGDFNDYPYNSAIVNTLQAIAPSNAILPSQLYDLCAPLQEHTSIGSHKFEGHWGMLDHIIVSGSLLQHSHPLSTTSDTATIFAPDWILESDKTGQQPFRTYRASTYQAGYSDHLPLLIHLTSNISQ